MVLLQCHGTPYTLIKYGEKCSYTNKVLFSHTLSIKNCVYIMMKTLFLVITQANGSNNYVIKLRCMHYINYYIY